MKQFILACVTSFALVQSAQAITSNLGESLREESAIINSETFLQTAISPSEFIIDLKRITKSLSATTVIYEITTRVSNRRNDDNLLNLESEYENVEKVSSSHRSNQPQRNKFNRYSVKLLLSQNPEIGPPLITLVSIKPILTQHTIYYHQAKELAEVGDDD